ncbi:MAG: hypothetical protein ACREGI_05930 [Candidatus Levyibacteriota bacterium]
MTNHEIAQLFREVEAAYSIKDEKKYRFQIIAYQKAADAIDNLTAQIKDLYNEQKLETISGVGPSIRSHLEELMKTGEVKRFAWVLQDIPKAIFPLLAIPGFGPKKAYKLVDAFGLKNPDTVIDDIEKLAKDGKIASLETFGEKSQSDILRAISEFRDQKGKTKRMLLPFAAELADQIVSYLKKSSDVKGAYPLGSLRRKKETVGDVDIAVATENPTAVIDYFTKYPYKDRIIEKGPATSSLLTSGGQQVDLMTQPVKGFGALLQHFTGSKNHNVHLRDYALKKGMSLSERGIKTKDKNGKETLQQFSTEEAFYNALGMDFIPPELREDSGEIELALSHSLPKLIKLTDIKADFHIHSSYPIEPSHDLGQNTMQEMLDEGKSLGYSYMGFSEHNPSVSKHNKNEVYAILERRKEKIEQLKLSNKNIRIINLLEIDILANGELAIDNKAFSYLDAGIVSVHSSFGMDTRTMTKRVLQGLSHPKAKILAHPTGRLINQRPGYSLDWEKIFAFCKEHNKALEINSWPTRLDLPDSLIKQAKEQHVKMVIDTDSHATNQMTLMKYGIWWARRGWVEKSDILNTLEYNDFTTWLSK